MKHTKFYFLLPLTLCLHSSDLGLLQKYLSEADERRTNDSHAVASARLKLEFADTDQTNLSRIQTRALELFHAHTKEMEEKYGKQKTISLKSHA